METYRPMTEQDLKYIRSWSPESAALSHVCGHVAVNTHEIPLLAGYLLECPNAVAYLSAFVASPHIGKPQRRKCIKDMVQYMTGVAKGRGVRCLISTPSFDSMTRCLKELDWTQYVRKVDYLWRSI